MVELSGDINNVVFLEIKTAGLSNNLLRLGYHNCVGQFGTVIMPQALSVITFCKTRGITEKGGNAQKYHLLQLGKEKASVATLSGSPK